MKVLYFANLGHLRSFGVRIRKFSNLDKLCTKMMLLVPKSGDIWVIWGQNLTTINTRQVIYLKSSFSVVCKVVIEVIRPKFGLAKRKACKERLVHKLPRAKREAKKMVLIYQLP